MDLEMPTTKRTRNRQKLGEHFSFRCPDDVDKLLRHEESATETVHSAVVQSYRKIDTAKGSVRCPKCAGTGYAADEELAYSNGKTVRLSLELAKRLSDEESRSGFVVKSLYALYVKRRKIKGRQCTVCTGLGKLFAERPR
jgi:hypothetical protein